MKFVLLDDHHAILLFLQQTIVDIIPSAEVVLCSTIHDAKIAINELDSSAFVICDLEVNSGRNTAIPELCAELSINCMVYSSHVDKVLLLELENCKVRVYVSKLSKFESLQKGIESLVLGNKYYCPFVTETSASKEESIETDKLQLTEGQIRVLNVMVKGFNRVQAAKILRITLTTLNNHIARAREMNDCENFDELLRRFRYWDYWNG